MQQPHEQAELASLAAQGDRAALLKLLERSRRSLCEYVARRIPAVYRSVIDAEDIVQTTHVDVFRGISDFTPRGDDSFDRWLRTVAAHRLLDAIRWHRAAKRGGGRTPMTDPPADVAESMVALLDWVAGSGKTPSRIVARAEAVSAMQAALDELPADYRRALWIVYIEGRPMADAARELGRSESAIRVLCHKARKRLAGMLGDRSGFLSRLD